MSAWGALGNLLKPSTGGVTIVSFAHYLTCRGSCRCNIPNSIHFFAVHADDPHIMPLQIIFDSIPIMRRHASCTLFNDVRFEACLSRVDSSGFDTIIACQSNNVYM